MRREDLPIDEPCNADWSAMEGDDLRRFCGKRDKHVHDLSAMTQSDAAALLERHRGRRLCVQYASDAEGRVLFQRPRVPLRRLPVLAGVGGSLLAACAVDAGRYEAPLVDGGVDAAAVVADAGDVDDERGTLSRSTRPGKAPCHATSGPHGLAPPHVSTASTNVGSIIEGDIASAPAPAAPAPSATSPAAPEGPRYTRGLVARPPAVKGKNVTVRPSPC